jgi:hypothetical protein
VDLKEINPVEVADYSVAKSLFNSPACVWWATHVIKKRISSIADDTTSYHKCNQKFGIEVSKIWDDCVRLDKENYNTLWQDEVRKEMNNVRVAFKIMNGEE